MGLSSPLSLMRPSLNLVTGIVMFHWTCNALFEGNATQRRTRRVAPPAIAIAISTLELLETS